MVYYITGYKGGIGKSFFSLALIHYLSVMKNKDVILIETDTSSPDVAYCCINKDENGNVKNKIYNVYTANTDVEDGWINIDNIILENTDKEIVINAPAKEDKIIEKYGDELNRLQEDGIEIVCFFVISDNGNSKVQLQNFLNTVKCKICVVKNAGRAGIKENGFTEFDKSEYKNITQIYISKGPDLISKYTAEADDKSKMMINEIASLSKGNEFFLRGWIKKMSSAIEKGIKDADYYNDSGD